MIIDEIMVVQKQDMQKHVRTPEITCTWYSCLIPVVTMVPSEVPKI